MTFISNPWPHIARPLEGAPMLVPVGVLGMCILIYIVMAVLALFVSIWIYGDAKARGHSGAMWVVMVVFATIIGTAIGLVVVIMFYLITRNNPPEGYRPAPPGYHPQHGGYHQGQPVYFPPPIETYPSSPRTKRRYGRPYDQTAEHPAADLSYGRGRAAGVPDHAGQQVMPARQRIYYPPDSKYLEPREKML